MRRLHCILCILNLVYLFQMCRLRFLITLFFLVLIHISLIWHVDLLLIFSVCFVSTFSVRSVLSLDHVLDGIHGFLNCRRIDGFLLLIMWLGHSLSCTLLFVAWLLSMLL